MNTGLKPEASWMRPQGGTSSRNHKGDIAGTDKLSLTIQPNDFNSDKLIKINSLKTQSNNKSNQKPLLKQDISTANRNSTNRPHRDEQLEHTTNLRASPFRESGGAKNRSLPNTLTLASD
ncbi:MAG: hypothetical protein AB7E55_29645 [Pigmentiphaga sp.]